MAGDVKIEVVQAAINTSTGIQDFTFPGLGTCIGAIFILSGATALNTTTDGVVYAIGACDGTREWCHAIADKHGVATSVSKSLKSNTKCMSFMLGTDPTTIDGEADFDSFITDGVRINWSDAPSVALIMTVILIGGVDAEFWCDVVAAPTINGNSTVVTTVGFTPDVLICVAGTSQADETIVADADVGVGFGVNTGSAFAQQAIEWGSIDGSASANLQGRHRSSRIYSRRPSEAAEALTPSVNGFTLTARADMSANDAGFVALGIDDRSASIVQKFMPTATGNDAVTGVGFVPQAVFSVLSRLDTPNKLETNDTALSNGLGIFTATDEFSTTVNSNDNNPTIDSSSKVDTKAVTIDDHTGTLENQATHVSMDLDGWTLNYSTADATARVYIALAIEEAVTGVAVIADFVMPEGWRERRQRDGSTGVEWRARVLRDARALIGNVLRAFRDSKVLAGWRGGVRKDSTTFVDWRGRSRQDFLIPAEHRIRILRDAAVPIEWNTRVERQGKTLVGVLRRILADRKTPVEWRGSVIVQRDALSSVEWRGRELRDSTTLVDWRRREVRNAKAPTGSTLRAIKDSVLPLSWRAAIVRDAAIPVEWRGAVAVTRTALLPSEWRRRALREAAIAVDFRAIVLRDGQIPVETTLRATRSVEVVMDATLRALLDSKTEVEWRGRQSKQAKISLGWRSKVSRDGTTLVDYLSRRLTTAKMPVDFTLRIVRDGKLRIEWTAAGVTTIIDVTLLRGERQIITALGGERMLIEALKGSRQLSDSIKGDITR